MPLIAIFYSMSYDLSALRTVYCERKMQKELSELRRNVCEFLILSPFFKTSFSLS